jgi:hypothetical protein
MNKMLATTLGFVCAAALVVQAQDPKTKPTLTAEQKAVKEEMLAKYDLNKDGKLERTEMAKMSKEDKAKWAKAFPHHKRKPSATPTSGATGTNTVGTTTK